MKFSTHALLLLRLAAEAWIYDPPKLENAPDQESAEWLSRGTDLFEKILEDDRIRNSPEVSFPQLLRAISEVGHTAFIQWGFK